MKIVVESGWVKAAAQGHMTTQKQYYAKVKRAIIRRGLTPVPAQWDEAGNCLICGEAGRCPGWHTEEEARHE